MISQWLRCAETGTDSWCEAFHSACPPHSQFGIRRLRGRSQVAHPFKFNSRIARFWFLSWRKMTDDQRVPSRAFGHYFAIISALELQVTISPRPRSPDGRRLSNPASCQQEAQAPSFSGR